MPVKRIAHLTLHVKLYFGNLNPWEPVVVLGNQEPISRKPNYIFRNDSMRSKIVQCPGYLAMMSPGLMYCMSI